MPRAIVTTLLALGLACDTSGGGPGQSMTTTPEGGTPGYGLPENAVTLVNLHPDEERRQLYSVNYQQLGLIPRCTPVHIDATSNGGIKFTVTSSGRSYDYSFHDSLVEDREKHIARYFGAACPETPGLNPLDLQGIDKGQAGEGMTKNGVILALGYPPDHATPNTDSDNWIYWKNRWDRFVVKFDNGIVASVMN